MDNMDIFDCMDDTNICKDLRILCMPIKLTIFVDFSENNEILNLQNDGNIKYKHKVSLQFLTQFQQSHQCNTKRRIKEGSIQNKPPCIASL